MTPVDFSVGVHLKVETYANSTVESPSPAPRRAPFLDQLVLHRDALGSRKRCSAKQQKEEQKQQMNAHSFQKASVSALGHLQHFALSGVTRVHTIGGHYPRLQELELICWQRDIYNTNDLTG